MDVVNTGCTRFVFFPFHPSFCRLTLYFRATGIALLALEPLQRALHVPELDGFGIAVLETHDLLQLLDLGLLLLQGLIDALDGAEAGLFDDGAWQLLKELFAILFGEEMLGVVGGCVGAGGGVERAEEGRVLGEDGRRFAAFECGNLGSTLFQVFFFNLLGMLSTACDSRSVEIVLQHIQGAIRHACCCQKKKRKKGLAGCSRHAG